MVTSLDAEIYYLRLIPAKTSVINLLKGSPEHEEKHQKNPQTTHIKVII